MFPFTFTGKSVVSQFKTEQVVDTDKTKVSVAADESWRGNIEYSYNKHSVLLNPQTTGGWPFKIMEVKWEWYCDKDALQFRQITGLTHKLIDAALIEITDPASNGFVGWKHALLQYSKFNMEATYEERIDWAEEMDRIRRYFSLRLGRFRSQRLCNTFKRTPMGVRRQLLRRSVELLARNGHGAIDSTDFDR